MKAELQKLENEINSYIKAGDQLWREIAKRLTRIRDEKLWADEHKTFKAYVEDRWGKQRTWAYQLIKSNVVVKQLTESVSKNEASTAVDTLSEAAARQLGRVPEEKRAEVIDIIVQSKKAITETTVKEAAIVVAKPPKEEDDMGTIIPEPILPLWHRRQEIQELITRAKSLRSDIQAKWDAGDFNISQDIVHRLTLVHGQLTDAMPEVVCGVCEGNVPDKGCSICGSTGFQSKDSYKRKICSEDRTIREKVIQQRKLNASPRLSAAMPRLNP
jgi:hypothetical protein